MKYVSTGLEKRIRMKINIEKMIQGLVKDNTEALDKAYKGPLIEVLPSVKLELYNAS